MAGIDRGELIDLLNRLGSTDDAAVLEAARTLHRQTSEAGLSWGEVIRPNIGTEDEPEDEPIDTAPVEVAPENAEVVRLIDRLMRKGVSEDTRHDLAEMKRQAADDTLDPDDGKYVRALARRLGV